MEDYVKETASGFHIELTWWKVRVLWLGWWMALNSGDLGVIPRSYQGLLFTVSEVSLFRKHVSYLTIKKKNIS